MGRCVGVCYGSGGGHRVEGGGWRAGGDGSAASEGRISDCRAGGRGGGQGCPAAGSRGGAAAVGGGSMAAGNGREGCVASAAVDSTAATGRVLVGQWQAAGRREWQAVVGWGTGACMSEQAATGPSPRQGRQVFLPAGGAPEHDCGHSCRPHQGQSGSHPTTQNEGALTGGVACVAKNSARKETTPMPQWLNPLFGCTPFSSWKKKPAAWGVLKRVRPRTGLGGLLAQVRAGTAKTAWGD